MPFFIKIALLVVSMSFSNILTLRFYSNHCSLKLVTLKTACLKNICTQDDELLDSSGYCDMGKFDFYSAASNRTASQASWNVAM
jgi:hypothetical protein